MIDVTINQSWPVDLPLPSIEANGQPQHATLASGLESAKIERRSRFQGDAPIGMIARWVFGIGAYIDFKTFFTTTLNNGVSLFTIELRYPQTTALTEWVARFVTGYDAQYLDGQWEVTAELQLLYQPSVPDEAAGLDTIALFSTTPRLSWLPDELKESYSDGILAAFNRPSATTVSTAFYWTWDEVLQAYSLLDSLTDYPAKCELLAWWQIGNESDNRWILRVQPDTALDLAKLQELASDSPDFYAVVGRRDYKSVGTPKDEHREMSNWLIRSLTGYYNEVSATVIDIEVIGESFGTVNLLQETELEDGIYPTLHCYLGPTTAFFIYPTDTIYFERDEGNDSDDTNLIRYIKATTANWENSQILSEVTAVTYDRDDTTMCANGSYSRDWGARVPTAAELLDDFEAVEYDTVEDLDTLLGKVFDGTATAEEEELVEHIDNVLGAMAEGEYLYYNE